MGFPFKARIFKVGINPCVKVPASITDRMQATKGFIPVKGTIEGHPFRHTLVPVKDDAHRLYVNTAMLKGAQANVGQTVAFEIEQDRAPRVKKYPMPRAFKQALQAHNLLSAFTNLTPGKQKRILHYLNYLKTPDALKRNIDREIAALKK